MKSMCEPRPVRAYSSHHLFLDGQDHLVDDTLLHGALETVEDQVHPVDPPLVYSVGSTPLAMACASRKAVRSVMST